MTVGILAVGIPALSALGGSRTSLAVHLLDDNLIIGAVRIVGVADCGLAIGAVRTSVSNINIAVAGNGLIHIDDVAIGIQDHLGVLADGELQGGDIIADHIVVLIGGAVHNDIIIHSELRHLAGHDLSQLSGLDLLGVIGIGHQNVVALLKAGHIHIGILNDSVQGRSSGAVHIHDFNTQRLLRGVVVGGSLHQISIDLYDGDVIFLVHIDLGQSAVSGGILARDTNGGRAVADKVVVQVGIGDLLAIHKDSQITAASFQIADHAGAHQAVQLTPGSLGGVSSL